MKAKIPYRIFGGLRFYDRKEIKDIICYLRLLQSSRDNQALLRVINNPTRGIGPQAVKAISDLANERAISLWEACQIVATKSDAMRGFVALITELRQIAEKDRLSELVRHVLNKTEYEKKLKDGKDPQNESRLENLKELVVAAAGMENPNLDRLDVLRQFLDRATLASSADQTAAAAQSTRGTLSLMTLHLAKGLEFKYVFITGMEEGLLPHQRAIFSAAELEEERRLCYVGITRAKYQLYLTRAVMRGMFSSNDNIVFREPSRFLFDIPQDLIVSRGADFLAGGSAVKDGDFEEGESDFGPATLSWGSDSSNRAGTYGFNKSNGNPYSYHSRNKKEDRKNALSSLVKPADQIKEPAKPAFIIRRKANGEQNN
jgi:DNA helicase-2/ATP-dependent DNA helicase PcrA